MPDRTLTLREINRATLSRQMLLDRQTLPVPAAVERLVGFQAQLPIAPYIGLWTRLHGFERSDLANLIESRQIVKATLMRATLHLFTADDYIRFRATLQPMLEQASASISRRRGEELDLELFLDAARKFIAEEPRTFAEVSEMLSKLMPDDDVGPLRYAVRMHLPLVQIPIPRGWSYPGNPQFTLAENWIGRPIEAGSKVRELVKRYLGAFGPASAADMLTWSGLPGLKETFEEMKPELQVYRDEARRELFDLPEFTIPDADIPAPVRFLPEYDNLLLSHAKRTRVIAEDYRKRVFLPGLRVRSSILVDGFVRAGWKAEKEKKEARMVVEAFDELSREERWAIVEEGKALLHFLYPETQSYEVRLT